MSMSAFKTWPIWNAAALLTSLSCEQRLASSLETVLVTFGHALGYRLAMFQTVPPSGRSQGGVNPLLDSGPTSFLWPSGAMLKLESVIILGRVDAVILQNTSRLNRSVLAMLDQLSAFESTLLIANRTRRRLPSTARRRRYFNPSLGAESRTNRTRCGR